MATITESTAVEPAFVVERFAVVGDRVEVAGHWRDVRGRRFVRPVLWLHRGESRRRLVAVLDHKPWAADDGEPWLAAFKWEGGKLAADKAELEVGRELVVELPLPGDRAPKRRPAKARPPSELDRVREQLLSATKERTALQAALDEATVNADDVTRLRAERDHAREEAERARADGERLVNDEYRQRERALQAAEAATVRARENDAARGLAERQLSAARAAHAKLEQRVAAAEPEIARLRAELAEAGDELDRLRTAAKAPRDDAELERLRAELAEAGDELDRLRTAAKAPRDDVELDQARTELTAARDELDRASADLAAANDDRARLRAELAAARDELAAPREQVVDEEQARLARELDGAWAERDRLAGDMAGVLSERDQLAAELAAARAGRERVEAELVAVRADRKRLERELGSLRSEREREPRPAARRPIRAAAESRLAPPQSGTALWAVRAVALGLVAILLAAIALAVAGVL